MGMTYFKITSPYQGDITKFCSLNGIEIDNNFLNLEGKDIKDITMNGNKLVVEFMNGDKKSVPLNLDGNQYTSCDDSIIVDNDSMCLKTNADLIRPTEDIKVTSNVGGYEIGDVINTNTSVEEFIRKLLNKVVDVKALPPSTQVTSHQGPKDGETYEVGENLGTITLQTIYSDGYFESGDKESWPDEAFDEVNGTTGGRLSAGCGVVSERFYLPPDYITPTTSGDIVVDYVQEQQYLYYASDTYGRSSVVPKKSDGSDSEVLLPAGETQRVPFSFQGAYKYFYCFCETSPFDEYDFSDITTEDIFNDTIFHNMFSGFCTPNGETVIPKVVSYESYPTHCLIIPAKYSAVTYTENAFNCPVTVSDKWKNRGTFTYTKGTVSTLYNVFVLHCLYPVEYRNIKFRQPNNA